MESPGSKSGSLGSQKTVLAKALWKGKAKLMSGVGASSAIGISVLPMREGE